MNAAARALIERVRNECSHIEEVCSRITWEWDKFQKSGDDAYLDAVALNLQALYTGIERCLVSFVRFAGIPIPEGPNWHAALLQMSVHNPATNPGGILSAQQKAGLDEYRAFRHVVRNVYAYNFDPHKMKPLVEQMQETIASVLTTLRQGADLLEQNED